MSSPNLCFDFRLCPKFPIRFIFRELVSRPRLDERSIDICILSLISSVVARGIKGLLTECSDFGRRFWLLENEMMETFSDLRSS